MTSSTLEISLYHGAEGIRDGPVSDEAVIYEMVDLTQQLSNFSQQLMRMLNKQSAQVSPRMVPLRSSRPRQRQVHMSRQQQLELVERYRAGALQRELAEAHGVHRRTVAGIVKRHGALRRQGLEEAQVDEAVQRYEAGESLATIGKALGVDAGTVRARLLERGVRMRGTGGKQKQPRRSGTVNTSEG